MPFPACSCSGWYSPVSLFTTPNVTHLPVDIQVCHLSLAVKIPRGHSSVNYLQHIHRVLFLPSCLDMCQGVSQLSNYSIYIPRCHSLPWLESFWQVFISGCVKILSFSLGWVNQNRKQVHHVNCSQTKTKHKKLFGEYWKADSSLVGRPTFQALFKADMFLANMLLYFLADS